MLKYEKKLIQTSKTVNKSWTTWIEEPHKKCQEIPYEWGWNSKWGHALTRFLCVTWRVITPSKSTSDTRTSWIKFSVTKKFRTASLQYLMLTGSEWARNRSLELHVHGNPPNYLKETANDYAITNIFLQYMYFIYCQKKVLVGFIAQMRTKLLAMWT
jgi:hypothetical protein